MREIGSIPTSIDPKIFGDYLLSIGVESRIVESKGAWSVWILHDDQLTKSSVELIQYLSQPDDPRYVGAKALAEQARREAAKLDRQYRRNVGNATVPWQRPNLQRKPFTSAIIGVCVVLFLAGNLSPSNNSWIRDNLLFFPRNLAGKTEDFDKGLKAILSGEVWRIWTPALLHANIVHILFNMWAMNAVGALIEIRKGTRFLAATVFVSAAVSNIAQYVYMINFNEYLIPFLGFSGVVYALFGYIWMKGRMQPEEGMMLDSRSVQMMLLWLLLGFVGFPFANGAHIGGLLFGVLLGLARF